MLCPNCQSWFFNGHCGYCGYDEYEQYADYYYATNDCPKCGWSAWGDGGVCLNCGHLTGED